MKAAADHLYQTLLDRGADILYDDRRVSAGVMFSDADLLGVPFRVIVSPRNIKQGVVEIVSRDKSFSIQVPMDAAAEEILRILHKAKVQTAERRQVQNSV